MRPTFKELEGRKWYRLWKVLTGLIVVLALIGPWVVKQPSQWLIIDGMIGVAIWLIVSFIIRNAIIYVLYGKKEKS